jgi:hypothetical protein
MSGLKLRARDAEDIQIISAVLQDSIVPLCDITFRQDDKTFIAVTQRLRRETEGTGASERICCALTINGVDGVQTHGIDQKDSEGMLDLLAIILEPAKCLNLVFAGDARIRLDLGNWAGGIEDFGEPWPALCHPCHDEGLGGASGKKA